MRLNRAPSICASTGRSSAAAGRLSSQLLAGAALGAGYAHHAGHTYAATAQVLVAPVTQGPLNLPSQVTLLVNMSTEQTVAQSGPVIDQAAKLMHVSATVLQADAAKDLTVAVPTTSDVLQITWQAKTAKAARPARMRLPMPTSATGMLTWLVRSRTWTLY